MSPFYSALTIQALLGPSLLAQATVGSPIHVVTVGNGPRTIIVLHGGPGVRHNYMRPEWDALSKAGKVVYYDQRGCGKSTRQGPFSWQRHVADLHQLITSNIPKGPLILAGSSWGSRLALYYVATHPGQVRALVLSGIPSLEGEATGRPRTPPPPAPSPTLPLERDSAWIVANPANIPPALALRMGPVCPAAGAAASQSRWNAPNLDSLRSIGVPVLLLSGSETSAVGDGASVLGRFLPEAQHVRVKGEGHDPWLTNPSDFFAAILQFIEHHTSK